MAGIMIGFQKIIYIPSTDKEATWMSMPSQATEYSTKVDYMNYTSPDPEDPERGFLAAEAVKLLIPYIRNFVLDNKGIMVPPPFPIDIPPLQTFTHIAVTGRVVARTMLVNQSTPKKEDPSNEEKTQGGPGSPSGSTPPPRPKIQSKIVQVTGNTGSIDDGMPDDEENEEDDVEQSEKGEEDDIKELEKLENAASSKKPKPKGAASKRQSSKTKGAAKKKAKGSKD